MASFFQKLRYWVFPGQFWRAYSQKAREAGLDQLYMVLSFDCDTDEDIPAARQVHEWLGERGVRGVFAVPGVQLEKGAETFRQMAAEGAEFINHGAAAHTEWRNGRYWSVNFYDQQSLDEVERDIRKGHEIVTQVIGNRPTGFRAPHFGHFQSPAQLKWLYELLSSMDYRYASTTVPRFLLEYGPCAAVGDIVEFPVTGSYRRPLNIFDSWTNVISDTERSVRSSYARRFTYLVQRLVASRAIGLINHYVDPAHVVGSKYFFDAVDYALMAELTPVTYKQVLDRI